MKKIIFTAITIFITLGNANAIRLEDSQVQPVAYVRMAPIKATMQKFNQTLQTIKPGPQSTMISAGIGLMLGDPTYGSFDEKENLAVYIFNDFTDEREPSMVAFVKVSPDSPMKATFKKNKALTLQDYKGWTIIPTRPGTLKKIGNLTPLLKHARTQAKDDLEAGAFIPTLLGTPMINKQIAEGLKEMRSQKDKTGLVKNGAAMLEILLAEARDLESISIGLELGKENIAIASNINARPGSPLSRLANAKSGGNVPEARLVPQSGLVNGIYHYDVDAIGTYWNRMAKKMMAKSDGKMAEWIQKTDKMVKESLPLYAGSGAYAMDMKFSNPAQPEISMLSVGATTSTDEQFLKILQDSIEYSDSMMKTIFQTITGMVPDLGDEDLDEIFDYKIEMKPSAFKVEGTPVHVMKQKTEVDGESTEQEYFYAIAKGNMLAASSRESITGLIKQAKAEKAVKNHLPLELPAGTITAGHLNGKAYLDIILSSMMSALAGLDEKESSLLQEMKQLQVDSWPYKLSASKNRMSANISLSHKSIKTLVDFFEKASKEMSDEIEELELEVIEELEPEAILEEPTVNLAKITLPTDLQFKTSEGEKTTLAALSKGKKAVLLDFWASWCGPCMALMPELKNKAAKLGPQGIVVAGMNVEGSAKKAERVRKKQKMDMPWLVEPKSEPFSSALKIDSIPRMILVAPDGKVLFNGHPQDPGLKEALAKLDVKL